MMVSVDKARQFVYVHGTLFERALFDYLFDGGSAQRVEQIIACYKNPDNGFGHGFEHDLKAPHSNPVALEYLLTVLKYTGVPAGNLLNGTEIWLEANMNSDGSLKNLPEIMNYPIAPWWQEWGGQTAPDSIVGNLIRFGRSTPVLIQKTYQWALENWSIEKIRANEWLFMIYHADDYFFNIGDFPNLEAYRSAIIDNIITVAKTAPENQYYSFLQFAPSPDSAVAQAEPEFVGRVLDYLASAQQEDGSWLDQHGIVHWLPIVTINVLLGLKRYGRLGDNS